MYLIAFNPNAGARSRKPEVDALAACLEQRGQRVRLVTDLDELTDLSASLLASGELSAVVAAGGDGTIAEVANRTPWATRLATLPLGTENLIARYFRYPRRPDVLADVIVNGIEHTIDAGRANDRMFVLMISAGFDADVVRRVAEARRGHITRMTYVKPILASMRTYDYPNLDLHLGSQNDDDADCEHRETATTQARWVFAMNLSKYALGLDFTPDAVDNDGQLDICAFAGRTFWSGFRYLFGIWARQHQRFRDAQMLRASRLRIEAPAGMKVPYQLDGDFGGFLPVEVQVLPRRLTFLLSPQMTAARRARNASTSKVQKTDYC